MKDEAGGRHARGFAFPLPPSALPRHPPSLRETSPAHRNTPAGRGSLWSRSGIVMNCLGSLAASNSRRPRREGDDRVRPAVALQQRAVIGGDLGDRIESRPHQPVDRQPGKMIGRHVGQRAERAFQHQSPGRRRRRPARRPRRRPATRPSTPVAFAASPRGRRATSARPGRRPARPARWAAPRSARSRGNRRSAPTRRRDRAACAARRARWVMLPPLPCRRGSRRGGRVRHIPAVKTRAVGGLEPRLLEDQPRRMPIAFGGTAGTKMNESSKKHHHQQHSQVGDQRRARTTRRRGGASAGAAGSLTGTCAHELIPAPARNVLMTSHDPDRNCPSLPVGIPPGSREPRFSGNGSGGCACRNPRR